MARLALPGHYDAARCDIHHHHSWTAAIQAYNVADSKVGRLAMKAGDIVQLKSGGPAMTIEKIIGGSSDLAVCVWFVGAENKTYNFRIEALKPYEEPKLGAAPSGIV